MKRNVDYKLINYNDPNCFDYHVHIGQFYDKYYEPHKIIEDLTRNGIKGCWFSSTTSCIKWDNENDKKYLIEHIRDEVIEAINTGKSLNFDARALYWVNLFEYLELIKENKYKNENVRCQVENYLINRLETCEYFGFKIHTRVDFWDMQDENIILIFDNICNLADKYNMPILIHSGIDETENPTRFEKWYKEYNSVKFIISHLKPLSIIIRLIQNYSNIYVDTAFASLDAINEIKKSEYVDRMIYGSDYPINKSVY